MGQARLMHQRPMGLQHIDHLFIGGEYMITGKQLSTLDKTAITSHRIDHRQVVALADDIVFQTMARGGVDGAGTRFQGDMLTDNHRYFTVVEAVLQLQSFKGITAAIGDDLVFFDIPASHGLLQQALGHQQPLLALGTLHLDHDIFETGVETDRLVSRQGPGCGGPDHHR